MTQTTEWEKEFDNNFRINDTELNKYYYELQNTHIKEFIRSLLLQQQTLQRSLVEEAAKDIQELESYIDTALIKQTEEAEYSLKVFLRDLITKWKQRLEDK